MNNQLRFPHSVRIEVELDGVLTHVVYSNMLDLHTNVKQAKEIGERISRGKNLVDVYTTCIDDNARIPAIIIDAMKKRYGSLQDYVWTANEGKYCAYHITFISGEGIQLVMTRMQRNVIMRTIFAPYIKTIGGLGYRISKQQQAVNKAGFNHVCKSLGL